MADKSRLQVKTVSDPEKWEDVGAGSVGVPVPVTVEGGNVTIDASDIEIGAVEIKNSSDDTRATVSSKGLHTYDTVVNSLVPSTYDYISLTEASTTDTWTFKTGGSSGTTVSTIVITYTDSGKETVSSIAKV